MKITAFKQPDGGRRLVLRGDLDVETVPELHRVAAQAVPVGNLEIDLAGVDFVDSTGLKGLLEIAISWQERGGQVLLLRPRPEVEEVFRLVGLTELLAVGSGLGGGDHDRS